MISENVPVNGGNGHATARTASAATTATTASAAQPAAVAAPGENLAGPQPASPPPDDTGS